MKSSPKKKMKMLFISQELPYRNVPHAGGKTLYYYLSQLVEVADITLLSFCKQNEQVRVNELLKLGIKKVFVIPVEDNFTFISKGMNKLSRICRYFYSPDLAIFHPGNETVKMKRELNRIKKEGYDFDLVQFEWTSSLAFFKEACRLFPRSRKVLSLHDFNSVVIDRKLRTHCKPLLRYIYRKQQNFEVEHAKKCDIVLVHSPADVQRVIDAGVEATKVQWLCPYFNDLKGCALKTGKSNKNDSSLNLLFFGAMWREENWMSIIEFILNVLTPLRSKGFDIRLSVLGAEPPQQLLHFHDKEAISIYGYVEDIRPFFENADMFVAPLLSGGGIKVKILEAMSAGLPVLGNKVAMEGILARDGYEYVRADSWEEWQSKLVNYLYKKETMEFIGCGGLNLVQKLFGLDVSYEVLINTYKRYL